jgi:hypothetical protein
LSLRYLTIYKLKHLILFSSFYYLNIYKTYIKRKYKKKNTLTHYFLLCPLVHLFTCSCQIIHLFTWSKITKFKINKIQFKNYKNKPQNSGDCWECLLGSAGIMAARRLHARPLLVARGLAMPRNGQTWDVFFSSPFSTGDLQKKTPNHNSQLILVVLSLFADLLFSLLCFQACRIWSSVWLHVPPTDQACGWLDRQPSSSHFISIPAASSTAAMVGRSAHLSSLGLRLFIYCPLLPFGLPSHFLIVSVMSCWRKDDAAAGLFEREPAEGRNGRERGEDDGSEMAGWSMEKNRGRWLCQ